MIKLWICLALIASIPSNGLGQVVTNTETLIEIVYEDIQNLDTKDDSWLCERSILAPRNDQVCLLNGRMLERIPGDSYADSTEEEEFYDDYYLNDLDQELFKKVSDVFKTTIPGLYLNSDKNKEVNVDSSEMTNYEDEKKFEEELDQYLKNKKIDPEVDGNLDDYQFEDNRSEVEGGSSKEGGDSELIRPLSGMISDKNVKVEKVDKPELSKDSSKVYKDADKMILEETKSILEDDEDTINEFNNDKTIDEIKVNDDISHIFDETSKILKDSNANEITDKDYINSGEGINGISESVEDFVKNFTAITQELTEDTVEKTNTDLISDSDKLHATWKKDSVLEDNLNEFGSDEKKQEIYEDDYEESSEDYEEIKDEELDKIFEECDEDDEGDETIDKMNKVLPYINDAIVANDVESNLLTSTVTSAKEDNSKKTSTFLQDPSPHTVETSEKPNINKMTVLEEDNLIKEFIKEHQSIYDIKASDVKNANNIRLTIETPVEVTSPDYPMPYPTDKTVDWMFTGDGMGIELNMTDFSINGHVGDYLLVKPGGVDVSGSTGIIFTYNLRTVRRYRFLDVDKMFVRFFANRGGQFMRGFKFSARMVVKRPGGLVEPDPEPQPGLPDPPATITLNLGGISLQNFLQIEEQFRHIIADMATLYINTNNINPGINTTLESTQITSKALCFHNWPKFELCTEVKFGVPIVHEGEKNDTQEARLNEKDLMSMWTFYSQRDPFAVQLRILGITEYHVPNDAGVLTLWLVVAGGVVLSAALLALALWRFNCFEDYTRMPIYGDTESITEKRTLDLYPTPHQTLPPLYSETDYKWADDIYDTDKVNLGFPNQSFLPDDAFEAPGGGPSRHRNFSFSPRDIYQV